jgi:hypothetical protein
MVKIIDQYPRQDKKAIVNRRPRELGYKTQFLSAINAEVKKIVQSQNQKAEN